MATSIDSALLTDGTSHILLTDGTSHLSLAGPVVYLDATLAPSGGFVKATSRKLAGALPLAGTFQKLTNHAAFGAILAPVGQMGKFTTHKVFSAVLAPIGGVQSAKTYLVQLAAALAPSGFLQGDPVFASVLQFFTSLSWRVRGHGHGHAKTHDYVDQDPDFQGRFL